MNDGRPSQAAPDLVEGQPEEDQRAWRIPGLTMWSSVPCRRPRIMILSPGPRMGVSGITDPVVSVTRAMAGAGACGEQNR